MVDKRYDLLGFIVMAILLGGKCPICLERKGKSVDVEDAVIHLYEHEIESSTLQV